MHKLSTDAKGVSTILSGNRVIDMDTEGREGEGVIVVANMLVELNTLYISVDIKNLGRTPICPGE
jgi:3,4-dihydroxy-2-butanone 4-phosphate synthase